MEVVDSYKFILQSSYILLLESIFELAILDNNNKLF